MTESFSAEERAFVRDAEIELLKVLSAWNVAGARLDLETRLVIEASLLMKFLVMIARDGLKLREGSDIAATLLELWRDDEAREDEMVN